MTRARIDARFEKLRAENRAAFVSFVTAGDPDPGRFETILDGLPKAGADLIEVGMPFTDPMADGPAIQASGQRALKAGMTVRKTLAAVERFRQTDTETPIVLMGYLNPIHAFGVEAFMAAAAKAGVDGLIIVDCPPEEDEWACLPALKADLAFIRLATPTTDDKRLPRVIEHMTGFVYYVSIAGITGAALSSEDILSGAVARLKAATDLPVCIGFGIKTAEDAAMIARIADGAVVGSAIVSRIAGALDVEGRAKPGLEEDVLEFVRTLSTAVRTARGTSA